MPDNGHLSSCSITTAVREGPFRVVAPLLLRDAQRLAGEDRVGIEDLVSVGLEDPRPQRGITVELLGDGRQGVAGFDLALQEPDVRVDEGASEDDGDDELADLGSGPGVEPEDLEGAMRRGED